jgi:hypothetical protein
MRSKDPGEFLGVRGKRERVAPRVRNARDRLRARSESHERPGDSHEQHHAHLPHGFITTQSN